MLLSKILIRLCMIIHYIVEKNIFVVIVYVVLKRHIKDCFKINGGERIIMPKKVNMFNSKIL